MLKGLYQAAEGMKVRLEAQDVISNNLANAGTAGFQREISMIRAERIPEPAYAGRHEQRLDVPRWPPLEHLNTYSVPDTHGGVLQRTGVGTDVALDGPGYLVVQTEAGLRLVRGGALHTNAEGHLVTLAGDPLLSTSC
jgi:flagellar basal-body rod protein FlgF